MNKADHIAAARKIIGPASLAMAVFLEAKHRATGIPRHILATLALSETVTALVIVNQAERLAAVEANRAGFEKFQKASAEAAARSAGPPQVSLATAGETEAVKREHEIMRKRRERRNRRKR